MSNSQPHIEWVQVAEVGELWQAELMAGRLREDGIEAQIIDQTFHQEPLPNVRAFAVVRVFVPKAQEDQAKRLMAEDVELLNDERDDEQK
jgi:Putative prokaryotic signal transducing protein